MHNTPFRWLLPAALAMAMSAAHAQQTPRPATLPDPLDAKAAVPALVYRSTLSSYRRHGDDKPTTWREANETVARIGGWRAYSREAYEAAAAESAARPAPGAAVPAASAPPKATPMPAGHGAHKTH